MSGGVEALRAPCARAGSTGGSVQCLACQSVLIIVENLTVPLDRRVWQEARTLKEAGYTVSVICPKGGKYTQELRAAGRHPRFPPSAALRGGWRARLCAGIRLGAVLGVHALGPRLLQGGLRLHPGLQSARPAVPHRRLLEVPVRQALHLRSPRYQPRALRGQVRQARASCTRCCCGSSA